MTSSFELQVVKSVPFSNAVTGHYPISKRHHFRSVLWASQRETASGSTASAIDLYRSICVQCETPDGNSRSSGHTFLQAVLRRLDTRSRAMDHTRPCQSFTAIQPAMMVNSEHCISAKRSQYAAQFPSRFTKIRNSVSPAAKVCDGGRALLVELILATEITAWSVYHSALASMCTGRAGLDLTHRQI
jgi:hypothetical protein